MSWRVAFDCDCFIHVSKAETCESIIQKTYMSVVIGIMKSSFCTFRLVESNTSEKAIPKINLYVLQHYFNTKLLKKLYFLKTQLKQRCCAAYDHEKKSKGFAHLDFVSVESAQAAVADSGRYFWGKELRVASAHPRPTTDPATKRIPQGIELSGLSDLEMYQNCWTMIHPSRQVTRAENWLELECDPSS